MAITALRTGAKLPIRVSNGEKNCIPLFIPSSLNHPIRVSSISIKPPPPLQTINEEENEPEVFNDVLPLLK
jgi:hypothetical protein